MIDIKRLTQQKNELKEVWDYLGIDSAFPDKQVRLWLLDYEKDVIESAFKVLAEKEEGVDEPVKYLAGILRNSKERDMTPEEREDEISLMRAAAAKVKAQKAHLAKVKAEKDAFAKVLLEDAEVCTGLQTFADGLQTFDGRVCDGVGVGVGASVREGVRDSAGDVEKSKPAAASPPVVVPPSEKKDRATPTPKTKTIKTARGERPKPDGFDTWSNLERSEWHACTADCYDQGWHFEHMRECALAVKPSTKAAASGSNSLGNVEPL